MAVVLVGDKITPEDILLASEEYGEYVKVVVDVVTGATAIGGEWHAEAEQVLLEQGSQQEDLWGGGISTSSRTIDFNSLINIRPKSGNDSMEILDSGIKEKFREIIQRRFGQ